MEIIEVIVKIIGIILFVAIITALPTMWLWDWLMPEIFGVTEITFWQAMGINVFCRILFDNGSSKSK